MEHVSGGNLCGIPGDVMDILANLECAKFGKPRWSVFSVGGGIGIKLLWKRNTSAHSPIHGGGGCHQRVSSKQRKERSQQQI